MTTHLDLTNAAYREAAAEILLRHDSDNAEANITSAIRNFLTQTGLAKAEEIVEENPPSDGSRRAVDLTALDTFIEVKRRIGANAGFDPDPANVQQLDDYLALSKSDGKGIRTGILTDGRYWLLRWPEAGPVRTSRPYGFVLESSDQWNLLREWLRDSALISLESIPADRSSVEQYLGPGSPTYQRDIDVLASLYDQAAQYETVRVKRRLWENLLRAALGEIAGDPAELDHLFIRHTYLSLVIGMAVQASFGIDLRQLAEIDPSDLLQGRRFRDATGLSGIIESDFFAWPDEVGGHDLLKALARRVARFDWQNAPPDIAAILYRPSFRPTNAAPWANTTPPPGWPGPWSPSWWTTRWGSASWTPPAAPAPSSPRPCAISWKRRVFFAWMHRMNGIWMNGIMKPTRHSCEGRNPWVHAQTTVWIPAFAGMTVAWGMTVAGTMS